MGGTTRNLAHEGDVPDAIIENEKIPLDKVGVGNGDGMGATMGEGIPFKIDSCSVSLDGDCCKNEDCGSGSVCKCTTSFSSIQMILF